MISGPLGSRRTHEAHIWQRRWWPGVRSEGTWGYQDEPTQVQRGQFAGLLGHAERREGPSLRDIPLVVGAGFVHGRETDSGLSGEAQGQG